jgi:carbonic anhydrase
MYQSPINISSCESIKIKEILNIRGKNRGATYNSDAKIFEINDSIILEIDSKRYELDEYHFHIPGEHRIDKNKYDAEIHYVFVEITKDKKNNIKHHNICGCNGDSIIPDENILVLCRLIKFSKHCVYNDVSMLQVKIPSKYFEYDGTLTTGSFAPVRWIIGKNHIDFNQNEIINKAKTSRKLQKLDGRIILFSKNN